MMRRLKNALQWPINIIARGLRPKQSAQVDESDPQSAIRHLNRVGIALIIVLVGGSP